MSFVLRAALAVVTSVSLMKNPVRPMFVWVWGLLCIVGFIGSAPLAHAQSFLPRLSTAADWLSTKPGQDALQIALRDSGINAGLKFAFGPEKWSAIRSTGLAGITKVILEAQNSKVHTVRLASLDLITRTQSVYFARLTGGVATGLGASVGPGDSFERVEYQDPRYLELINWRNVPEAVRARGTLDQVKERLAKGDYAGVCESVELGVQDLRLLARRVGTSVDSAGARVMLREVAKLAPACRMALGIYQPKSFRSREHTPDLIAFSQAFLRAKNALGLGMVSVTERGSFYGTGVGGQIVLIRKRPELSDQIIHFVHFARHSSGQSAGKPVALLKVDFFELTSIIAASQLVRGVTAELSFAAERLEVNAQELHRRAVVECHRVARAQPMAPAEDLPRARVAACVQHVERECRPELRAAEVSMTSIARCAATTAERWY